MIKKVNSIISATWIYTADKDNTLLDDHAIVILEDEIFDILPTKDVLAKYEEAVVLAFSNPLLFPGLIINNSLAALWFLKASAINLPLKSWLEDHIWQAEKQQSGKDLLKMAYLLALAELIK